MTDAYTLLQEYIATHSTKGEADPLEWLDRVEGRERSTLAALIDAYLERVPIREWDPEAFSESGLAPFAEQVNTALHSQAGNWPVVLPRLREKARLKRADLVGRLAAALGVADKQAKVGSYYHEMEQGLLPSEGVDDSVLNALGSILGQSGAALRTAGQRLGSGGGGLPAMADAAPAFARARLDSVAYSADEDASLAEEQAEWDEVDRLFRGR